MAESAVKMTDVTPEVAKVEVATESAPASPPISEVTTPEKTTEDASAIDAEKSTALEVSDAPQEPAVQTLATAPEASTTPVEQSVTITEESKDVKVEPVETTADTKEEVAAAVDVKSTDAPASTKSDHPSLFQKFKKTFEFPKISKNKESPSKEALSKETLKEALKETPKEEVESAEVATPVQASAPDVTPQAATTESKPTTGEKLQEKVSEGKSFFNKLVKKSFFTKSHSFSGAIPETKQGTTPAAAAPSAIVEVPKEVENVPVSTPLDAEATALIVPEPVTEATTPEAVVEAAAVTEIPAVVADEAAPPASETVTSTGEDTKAAVPSEGVEEKTTQKEDKPKNKFFQKIVRRLLPKNSAHNNLQTAAPAAAPVVAASA